MPDETPNPQIPQNEMIFAWGYPDTYSVFPGETLRLHVSSQKKAARVRVYSITQFKLDDNWDGAPKIDLGRIELDAERVSPNRNDTDLGIDDWLWPQNVNIDIPGGMETGIYIVEIVATAGQSQQTVGKPNWVMFVVKNPNPSAPILYKFCINTVHAYNLATHPYFGLQGNGFATYSNNFYENPRSSDPNSTIMKVTMRRPTTRFAWSTKSILNDYPLVLWMQKQRYQADFCTDVDVHLDTNLAMLSRYSHLVSPGHDEYWSRGMYDNLTAFRDRGGNLSFLSGNTCCWEVHMGDEDNGIPTSFFTDKGAQRCDVNGPDAWWRVQGGPENRLIGVGTRHCGIRGGNTNPFDAQIPASPGYRIQNANHWVLANTGLADGQVIGVADLHRKDGSPIVENFIGYEGGGVRITMNNDGSATPTYDDGTPRNFVILGVAPTTPVVGACNRTATDWAVFSREGAENGPDNDPYASIMGFYSAYGSVFTGSTIYWGITVNSFDTDAGFWRDVPREWIGGAPTVDGHPVLGNPKLHRIMRNLFDSFQRRERSVVAVADINGDGLADLVLQTDATGEPSYWLMESIVRVASGSILSTEGSKGPNLRIVGVGNFTAADSRDLLWQDQTDGHLEMSTLTVDADGALSSGARTAFIPDFADPAFRVAAVLDLNNDGRADVLFQNRNDGTLFFWVIVDLARTESGPIADATPGRLVAAVDLNGDGQHDLVFQKNDGSLEWWERNGITFPTKAALPAGPSDPEWRVVGAGDFQQEPSRIIVFQHGPSGDLHFSSVNNLTEESSGAFEPSSNPQFLH